MTFKQVIVIRHDLHMRMGKAAAQAAHASMMFLVNRIINGAELSDDEILWLVNCGMTKICLRVDSEQELLDINKAATDAGLTTNLITDSGRTEFQGVPTKTCLAIGPGASEVIDKITGGLKLL